MTSTQQVPPTQSRLHRALDRITRRRAPHLPPPQVLVQAPGWEFVHGDPERPFHAASAGKLMTTALVAMLIDGGRLTAATPLGELLPAADVAGLPAAPGVDPATDITVEHLLEQTSGLPDYFETRRRGETRASRRSAVENPSMRWTPSGLLDEAKTLPPEGCPGERYVYSDTNWVLMGRIIEEANDAPLATVMRTRIFDPIGMERASTPYDATVIPDDLSGLDVEPFWIGRHELSRSHCVSLDWAGGNVVAPPREWVRFLAAWQADEQMSAETRTYLERPRNRFRRGIAYGAGTMTLRFHELVPFGFRGLPQPVGHLGIWAAHAFFYPEQDAYVVLNFHSTRKMQESFMVHMQIARALAG